MASTELRVGSPTYNSNTRRYNGVLLERLRNLLATESVLRDTIRCPGALMPRIAALLGLTAPAYPSFRSEVRRSS